MQPNFCKVSFETFLSFLSISPFRGLHPLKKPHSEKGESEMTREQQIKEILALKNCTKCGKAFKKGDARFPYPEKQVLCKECFFPSLKQGIARLNRVLAGKVNEK